MFNINDKFVILSLSMVHSINLKKEKKIVNFTTPYIIEITAVKIELGEISEHLSYYTKIDKYNPNDYEFSDFEPLSNDLTPSHLIGANSLEYAISVLHTFCSDCTIIFTEDKGSNLYKLDTLNFYSKTYGLMFNNPALNFYDLLIADLLKKEIDADEWEYTDLIKIANIINLANKPLNEIYIEYDINEKLINSRKDSLTKTLAIAEIITKILDFDESEEEIPF